MIEINAFIGMPSGLSNSLVHRDFPLQSVADHRTGHRPSNCILQAARVRYMKLVWLPTPERFS